MVEVVTPSGETEPPHVHRWQSVVLVDRAARVRYDGADGEFAFHAMRVGPNR